MYLASIIWRKKMNDDVAKAYAEVDEILNVIDKE